MEEIIEYINARERFLPRRSLEPMIDEPISRLLGIKVLAHDPRVIKLIVKWRRNKPMDSLEPDNFLDNPHFVEELKEVLNVKL